MYSKTIFILLSLLLFFSSAFAQNQLKNPGFEDQAGRKYLDAVMDNNTHSGEYSLKIPNTNFKGHGTDQIIILPEVIKTAWFDHMETHLTGEDVKGLQVETFKTEPSGRDKVSTIKVAGLQMNVTNDIVKNKNRILSGMKEAAGEKAIFLVTPEGSLSGYHCKFNQTELLTALQEIISYAKELKLGLLLGTCFKNDQELCYNQIRVYTPEGIFLGAHSKILICSPIDSPGTGEMLDYQQGVLQTFEWNNIRFGTLVCNDLWATPGYTTIPNPYLPLKLKQMGAEVIFHSINSGTNQFYRRFHESSAELWALNLHIPIMEVNAAQGKEKINAQSGLIDSNGVRSVVVPDTGEYLYYCEINLNKK